MAVSETNRRRYRAKLVAREVKWIFQAVPGRFAEWLIGRFMLGALLRWLFLSEEGQLHRAGEIVLAELRLRYAVRGPFSTEPLEMARRCGQREVIETLTNYLNLDENTVQQLMELDDGLG